MSVRFARERSQGDWACFPYPDPASELPAAWHEASKGEQSYGQTFVAEDEQVALLHHETGLEIVLVGVAAGSLVAVAPKVGRLVADFWDRFVGRGHGAGETPLAVLRCPNGGPELRLRNPTGEQLAEAARTFFPTCPAYPRGP